MRDQRRGDTCRKLCNARYSVQQIAVIDILREISYHEERTITDNRLG